MCPICKVELKPMDRLGVEIDYCPQCRGVWLDRGELDKIIERTNALQAGPGAVPDYGYGREEQRYYRRDDDDDHEHDGRYGEHGPRGRRRGGFLDDLFDFG